ncbi:MAG: lysylphosphatidylglycerol synthase transmembrane domain-containing protein [Actinomycetota bacterium]
MTDQQHAEAPVAEPTPLFPLESEVPRRRRASDFGRLLVAGTSFVLLGWIASGRPEPDARMAEALTDLPTWLRTLAWGGFTAAAIGAVGLVAVAIASPTVRRDVVRDLVWTLVGSALLALVASRASTGAWPYMIPEVVDAPERLPFPTARVALVVTVSLVLSSYASAGVQRTMRWMSWAVVITPLLLGFGTLTAMLGALALSFLSVAAVRLAFGSPEGLPSTERLISSLSRSGIPLRDVAYAEDQPGTVGLAHGTTDDGRRVRIKIYGEDAASRQRAERVWRTLWYRSAGPSPRAGRSEQAQHEALAVLAARESGIDVPALVGAGQEPNGDAVIVSEIPKGTALGELVAPTDGQLAAAWRELRSLHVDAHLAHGTVDPDTVRLDGDRAQLADLSSASLMPTPQQTATDVVSMLASQSIAAGADRAVDAAVSVVDPSVLEAALPYAQDAVLDPSLRAELKSSDHDAEELGGLLAERLDLDAPEPAAVRRVSWSDLFIAVAAIVAANALISQIADVGLDTLLDELADASAGWLVVAFVVNLTAYGTAYFALKAIVDRPLPFLPVTLLQSAKTFVGLVVPSMVGRVGLDIRFLQVSGVPVVTASTQGPVIGFFGFVAEVALLAVSAWAIGQELDTDGLGEFDGGGLIALALLVVVVGLAIVFGVPRLRERVVPVLREAFGSVRSIVTSPGTMARIFTSELADRLIKALALGATVAAFGGDLPFPALVFVSVGTGLLAGLAPVPGGIGVAEATMSGLLTAAGLPAEQSVSIAIVHRVVTSYLTPVLGFFSLNWLQKEGHL